MTRHLTARVSPEVSFSATHISSTTDREVLPNALHINIDVPHQEGVEPVSIGGADPNALFPAFYRRRYETEPPEEVATLFTELYEDEIDAAD